MGDINATGTYFSYSTGKEIVICNEKGWKKVIRQPARSGFSPDGKSFLYQRGDTLAIITLAGDELREITGIRSWEFINGRLLTNGDRCILDGKYEDTGVMQYWIDKSALLMKTGASCLRRLDLTTYKYSDVITPVDFSELVISGNRVALAGEGKLVVYDFKKHAYEFSGNVELKQLKGLSKDGKRVFGTIASPPRIRAGKSPYIWHYQDAVLQSYQQLTASNPLPDRTALITADTVILLSSGNEQFDLLNDDYGWASEFRGMFSERFWNDSAYAANYLVDLHTGARKKMAIEQPVPSPDTRYIAGFDKSLNRFVYYDLTSGITHPFPDSLTTLGDWNGSDHLTFYDEHNIWDVSLNGTAVNLTKSDHIIYRPSDDLICGFDTRSRINNLYRLTKGKLQQLTASDYFYGMPRLPEFAGPEIKKASLAGKWLVKRQHHHLQPNYFVTSDFKNFHPVSDVNPAAGYNWPSAELVSYLTPAGNKREAMIYKPSGFDPQLKHPVIFNYYEHRSHSFNTFLYPDYAHDEINIPWMCSKGYVVIVPDIEVESGNSGNSIMDCIDGAYNFLQSTGWADMQHLGLNGHSFGGYETQYIITRTNKFAAAMASSGMSDLVSLSGELTLEEGIPYQREWAEIGQGKLGKTLWDNPSLYLENSPLLHADKITTPLLMMNNKQDGVVNFSQGIEMFTALRRLRKRVWMLQYENEYHSLYSPAMKDYTLRLDQFYDHYLKGAPMPAWMQYGSGSAF